MLSKLETSLVAIHGKGLDATSLEAFHKSVQELAKTTGDDKSRAFCYLAALWLLEQPLFSSKDETGNLLLLYDRDNRAMVDYALHYSNYFAVISASFSPEGEPMFGRVVIDKLTQILDIAVANRLASPEPGVAAETERYYFIFATRSEADDFVRLTLTSLPAQFTSRTGTTPEIFGDDFIAQKNISREAYAVELSCHFELAESQKSSVGPSRYRLSQPRGTKIQPYIRLWQDPANFQKHPGSVGAGVSVRIF